VTGDAGTFAVTTSGGFPIPSLSETGPLPSGVTFVDNNNGTATLSGTPAAGSGGTYPITITASNGVAPDATQAFTLTVNQSAAITSKSRAAFTKEVLGSFTPMATGYPAPTVTESGALPTGVTFAGGELSGTPTVTGTFHITFTADNGVGADAIQRFTLKVLGFHVTTKILPNGTQGVAYSAKLKALGGTAPYVWATLTAPPGGLTLSSKGLLHGTVPTTVAAGTYGFNVQVTDATLPTHQVATATVEITVG
jgi:hypothetical protein